MFVIVFVGAACAKKSTILTPLDIVQMSSGEFHADATTIALASTVVVAEMEDMEPVTVEFDSLIETSLREAGFSVVPAREFSQLLEKAANQVGGVYDPETGEPDREKIRTIQGLAIGELRSRFEPDAVLYPTIEVVVVEFDGNKVRWLGTDECATTGDLKLFGCGTGMPGASLPALTLFVTIRDMDGSIIFRNGGGIQLQTKYKAQFGGWSARQVPRDELFVDKERSMAAVTIALNPIVGMR
jgi:hypothetical protein